MFSLRQAFNAGFAGLSGVAAGIAFEAHQPEWAIVDAIVCVASAVYAGIRRPDGPAG